MNLDEAKIYVLNLSRVLADKRKDYLLLAGKFAEGILKSRVFGDGKATQGSIGKYKDRKWAVKRFNAGRQIGYVDLNFTGSLMNSIQVGEDKNDVAVYINNDKKYDIARGQEQLQGRKVGKGKIEIWNLSDDEQELVMQYIEELIDEQIDKL
jgi:hypothetical protein